MVANPAVVEPQSEIEMLLASKGYTIVRPLGEGGTRIAYEVEYRVGDLVRRRVAKIPKFDTDPESFALQALLAKGNPDAREVRVLNDVAHNNIVSIEDVIPFGDRTITVEDYYEAVSLEDLVIMSGPITEPRRFSEIFSQVLSGLGYLHVNKRLLHKDLKPSNILVGRHDRHVKISDLQTAGPIDGEESLRPTKGGSSYTHPKVLNALVSGERTKYDLESENYALGATMYWVLTGERFLDVSLSSGEAGDNVVSIDGRNLIVLKEDGKQIDKIDLKKYKKTLKEKLKKVPRRYRKLLRYCLELEDESNFRKSYALGAHTDLSSRLVTATNTTGIDWGRVRDSAIAYSVVTGILTSVVLSFAGLNAIDKRAKLNEPTLARILDNTSFTDSNLSFLNNDMNEQALESLKPYFRKLRERLPEVNSLATPDVGFIFKEGRNIIELASEGNRLSGRLGYSLIRSVLMQDEAAIEEEYGNSRYGFSLVPRSFVIQYGYLRDPRTDPIVTDSQKIGAGVKYLKHCIGVNHSIADVYATYFASDTEIFQARYLAQSTNYFSRTEVRAGKEVLVPGYSEFLPRVKKDLVNTALANYYLTDPNGQVHLEVLDSTDRPTLNLDKKLSDDQSR